MFETTNLTKSFKGQQALKSISLAFESGKTTVIVGPSGSGKSTLLRCLNLLELPETGMLTLNECQFDFDKKVTEKQILALRRKTGMVFQGFHLFPHLSILDNITEGPIHVLGQSKEEAQNSAKLLLEKVGLSQKADSYPDQLSGGQQQRAAIARALAMNPLFLLFDEPTSALDPELEAEVLVVLKDLSLNGNSQIIVTHNLSFAKEVADRMIFLEDGQIHFSGSTDDFFSSEASPRIQKFIAAMQF